MASEIYLKEGLYFRLIGRNYVFLDSIRNRYFSMTERQSEFFSSICALPDQDHLEGSVVRFVHHLIGRAVLTTSDTEGRPIQETSHETSEAIAEQVIDPTKVHVTLTGILKFAWAIATCAALKTLHSRNVSKIFSQVQRWKGQTKQHQPHDLRIAFVRAAEMERMSPFFFSNHDACFFRSLLIVRYLASFGVSSTWVFAVRLAPFCAHCWVEVGGIPLNEDIATISEYKVIMTI